MSKISTLVFSSVGITSLFGSLVGASFLAPIVMNVGGIDPLLKQSSSAKNSTPIKPLMPSTTSNPNSKVKKVNTTGGFTGGSKDESIDEDISRGLSSSWMSSVIAI